MSTVRYIAGYNLPGYLPDTEPFIFDTKDEANEYLEMMKSSYLDDMGSYDDPYVYWIEPYEGDDDAR